MSHFINDARDRKRLRDKHYRQRKRAGIEHKSERTEYVMDERKRVLLYKFLDMKKRGVKALSLKDLADDLSYLLTKEKGNLTVRQLRGLIQWARESNLVETQRRNTVMVFKFPDWDEINRAYEERRKLASQRIQTMPSEIAQEEEKTEEIEEEPVDQKRRGCRPKTSHVSTENVVSYLNSDLNIDYKDLSSSQVNLKIPREENSMSDPIEKTDTPEIHETTDPEVSEKTYRESTAGYAAAIRECAKIAVMPPEEGNKALAALFGNYDSTPSTLEPARVQEIYHIAVKHLKTHFPDTLNRQMHNARQAVVRKIEKYESAGDRQISNLNAFIERIVKSDYQDIIQDKKPLKSNYAQDKGHFDNRPHPPIFVAEKTTSKNAHTLASALAFISVKNTLGGRPRDGYISPEQYSRQKGLPSWLSIRWQMRSRMRLFAVNYIRKFGMREISLEELDVAFGTSFAKGETETAIDLFKKEGFSQLNT